jgi:AsmA protein
MKTLFKYLLLPLIGLVSLAVIAIFILFVAIDPNRYKPALESVFAQQTGLQLNIAGDINWTFRPVFGLSLEDVRITNNISPRELASFTSASLAVAPASLFGDTLRVEEFQADDLHVNWIVDASGASNWFPESRSAIPPPAGATGDAGADDASAEAEPSSIAAEIEQISIRNARIAIQDAQRGINTSLENINISSTDTNFSNRTFPFEASFRFIDYTGDRNLRVSMESTAAIDYEAGNAQFTDLNLSLSPLNLTGKLAISDFHNTPAWSGELASNTFNLAHFMENFMATGPQGAAIPGSFDNSSGQFTVNASFSGDNQRASIPTLSISLDDMRAEADVEFRFATESRPANLIYRITANALDLDAFMTSTEVPPPADEPAETAPADDIPIPVELLNSMNVIGNHSIEKLTVAGLDLNDINMVLRLENGVLNTEIQAADFYQGSYAMLVNLDAKSAEPVLTLSSGLQNTNLVALAESVRLADFARGLLNIDSQLTLRGSTVNQMLDSLSGPIIFNLAENSVDIGMIKQVFGAISTLSPSGEIGQNWPDTLSFTQFEGLLSFDNGISSGQQLQLRMDNLDIAGTGGIDLAAERFDYTMQFTVLGAPAVQTIPVNPTYQGIAWPVQCSAEFSAEPRQFCGPDFQKVREVFGQIARNEVERRVDEAITDKVPEELQDAVRGLRNIFRR